MHKVKWVKLVTRPQTGLTVNFVLQGLRTNFKRMVGGVKEMLRDYQNISKGKLLVEIKDPTTEATIKEEAEKLGIQPVQFNVVGTGELSVKRGYIGLALAFAEKQETLPFVQNTDDLEYQLTSIIRKLTIKDKKRIAFLTGHGEKSLEQDYSLLKKELEKQFAVESLTLEKKKPTIPQEIDTLVIAGPSEKIDDASRKALTTYLSQGGSALFLVDTISLDPQSLSASLATDSGADFVKDYGVEVQNNLVYDLQSNTSVRFGGGLVNFILPYPLWVRALPKDPTSLVTHRIDNIILPWASELKLNQEQITKESITATELFTTSATGGVQESTFSLKPDTAWSGTNLAPRLMAVSLSKEATTKEQQPLRMMVIGDSELFADQLVDGNPINTAFAVNAMSWLTADESIADLVVKQRPEARLVFENTSQAKGVKYGNMVLAFILPLGIGAYRIVRRKRLATRTYTPTV